MDIFDQAQELERLDRESALCRARAALYREGPEWINGEPCCRECGDPIPPKRLEALPGVRPTRRYAAETKICVVPCLICPVPLMMHPCRRHDAEQHPSGCWGC